MILIDLNQVLMAGIMAHLSQNKDEEISEDLIRHMVLNILRGHIKKFKKDYGTVVLCSDSRKYWRKDYFQHYKAGRKVARESSGLDWEKLFEIINKIKVELKESFPYKMVQVDGAEADDIIGTLVPRYITSENIIIISSDGDFVQLQRWNNKNFKVKQLNPILKKWVETKNPEDDLKEKIIRGDKGDGIPNILSPGNTFVEGKRQSSIKSKLFEELMSIDPSSHSDEEIRIGYSRNKMLIDLTMIPSEIKEKIIEEYDNVKPANRQRLLSYFINKKLKLLIDSVGDF